MTDTASQHYKIKEKLQSSQ